jgi:hypothetical protein
MHNDLELNISNTNTLSIPSRSVIYNIFPIGVGTPFVESLTSYISRLAEQHCLKLNTMVKEVIIPRIEGTHIKKNPEMFFSWSRLINTKGEISSECIRVVEELTERKDIKCLTLSSWENLCSDIGLISKKLKWCPACFEDFRINKKVIYEPLIWKLDFVEHCSFHGCKLENICFSCNKNITVLTNASRVGYCPYCHNWLGYNALTKNVCESNECTTMNRYIGELIALTNSNVTFDFRDSIRNLIELVTGGNVNGFSRIVNANCSTLESWCLNEKKPTLRLVMNICKTLEITPKQLLLFEFPINTIKKLSSLEIPPKATVQKGKQKKRKPVDAKKLKADLMNVIKSDEYPPPCMKEVANRLGRNHRVIYRYYPKLCNQISAKYLKHRSYKKRERMERILKEVIETTRGLYRKGIVPTERILIESLSTPGNFKHPEVRKAYMNTLVELGIKD